MSADDRMSPGAVGGGSRGRACATIGCEALVLTPTPCALVYCRPCRLVLECIFHGGEIWGASLRALRELESVLDFVTPYPDALPCIGCVSPRAALPDTVWCSTKCRRSVRSFVHRSLRLVSLGGVTLPEKCWRHLRGLGGGTYRERRLRLGVAGAIVMPLDTRRSRSARVGVAARLGTAPPDDGLALRDLVRSMSPKIRTFT